MTAPAVYATFIENNDWEGETWKWYIPIAGNEDALTQLSEVIEAIEDDDNTPECPYEVDLTPIPEWEVDVLIKHRDTGYLHSHNKLAGKLNLPEEVLDQLADPEQDPFRKGEIEKYVHA